MQYLGVMVVFGLCLFPPVNNAEDTGRTLHFNVEQGGAPAAWRADVKYRHVIIYRVSGPGMDVLFNAENEALYIINHDQQDYYFINNDVIAKAAYMIDSVTSVIEPGQGVLKNLLRTLGLSQNRLKPDIETRRTDTILHSAGVPCRLHQQYRDSRLQSEFCIAHQDDLHQLGDSYATLESFYIFARRLVTRAGVVLKNMGVAVPDIQGLFNAGLPVIAHVVDSDLKARLQKIEKSDTPRSAFRPPSGYRRTTIPFLG